MKTYIPGKDAPLEETIDRATSKLEELGIEVATSNWLNPAPHCWSVHIQSTRCPALYTNGKGTSRLASLASGLGEFFERLSTDFFFADYMLAETEGSNSEIPFVFSPDEVAFPNDPEDKQAIPVLNSNRAELLTEKLRYFYDPEGELQFEHLLDNNVDFEDKPIYTLPFFELGANTSCYFPISLLNNLYVSNGMAAGNNPAECDSQALSEIIERYVKNFVIAQGIALPDIPVSYLQSLANIRDILARLSEQGFHVRVKDSSLGGRFPVICVLLMDRSSGGVFASFGCNCRLEIAIERTLTELLQGRTLNQLHDFHPPVHDLSMVSEPYNLENHFINSDGLLCWSMWKNAPDFNFSRWDFAGTTTEEFTRLYNLIQREGLKVYKSSYAHCGMYVCRLVVPSMSEIYPVDDLVWNNRNAGAQLRQSLLKLHKMTMEELEIFLAQLDILGFDDNQLISHIAGLIFDEGTNWSTLRIGELKAMTHLALKDHRSSLEWCSWCIEFGGLPSERIRWYRLVHTLLGFRLQNQQSGKDYRDCLVSLYSQEDLQTAQKVLLGECRFFGLHFRDRWSSLSKSHEELLSIYNKIQIAKISYNNKGSQPA